MKNPLVSICIPTYNGERYLQEALDSVKAQTYKNIEVIISDDNSKDHTLEICDRFKNEVDFPVYIYNHTPSGIGANWNHCVEKANGEYIKFLFQDDVLDTLCIQKMSEFLENNRKIGLVACKRLFINNSINQNSDTISNWISKYSNLQFQLEDKNKNISEYYLLDNRIFKRDDFFSSPLNKIGEPSVVMFSKVVFKKIGFFNNSLKQILDYEYFYRILKKYPIGILNKPLVYFRIHDDQETNQNRNRSINDYELYEQFQYKELLFFVNRERRKYLLKKYNKIYKFLLSIYYKIRYS